MVKVNLSTLFVLSVLSSFTSAAPLFQKRIAQNTVDAKTPWEQACDQAGGALQCNPIAVNAAGTLLRGAGDCDQQDAADQMIDLAKELNNDSEMIRLAQIFVQQPRNAPDSLQVPYCQKAPKNEELNGLFHCQFEGSKFPNFSGDQTGNVPLGLDTLDPAGSCPAHPDGPVPDGAQLNTLVQDPFAGGAAPVPLVGNSEGNGDGEDENDEPDCGGGETQEPTSPSNDDSGNSSDSGNNDGGDDNNISFTRQNGIDAKALNEKFVTLSADSPCDEGENACIGSAFAKCNFGKFVVMGCGSGTICAALPLVNSPGTSITCTTAADRDARIAATGA